MTTLARRNSSIHKIREHSLPKVNLEDEYEVLQVLQEGWRGRILLVEHKRTRNEVVLKAIHRESCSRVDFFREFHYNYYLSPHPHILNAYDVAFQVGDYFIFAQEYAPFSDLTSNLSETGLGEMNVKKIALQLSSALEFMHSQDLVHRDVVMDNILVFNSDFSEVKLCDFGSTKKNGVLIKKKIVWLPYSPPEVINVPPNESFHVDSKQDVWQFGILIFVILTGTLPWQRADVTDPHFGEFVSWKKRKTLKTPKRFINFTTKALRLFKRILEPKPEKRASIVEVRKYMQDKWLVRNPKRSDDVDNQSVCYSTFSVHSSKIEKDKVLHALKVRGIETTVDRAAKRKRIREWIEGSVNSNLSYEEDIEMIKNSSSKFRINNSVVRNSTAADLTIPLSNITLTDSRPNRAEINKSESTSKQLILRDKKPLVSHPSDGTYTRNSFISSVPNIQNNKHNEKVSAPIESQKFISTETLVLSPVIHRRNSDKHSTEVKRKSSQDLTFTQQPSKVSFNRVYSKGHSTTTAASSSLAKSFSKSQTSITQKTSQSQEFQFDNLFQNTKYNNHSQSPQKTATVGKISPNHSRSRSARARTHMYYKRSRSLARDEERELQRSKTEPKVDQKVSDSSLNKYILNRERRESSGSDSSSNESVTSVVPIAGYSRLT